MGQDWLMMGETIGHSRTLLQMPLMEVHTMLMEVDMVLDTEMDPDATVVDGTEKGKRKHAAYLLLVRQSVEHMSTATDDVMHQLDVDMPVEVAETDEQ